MTRKVDWDSSQAENQGLVLGFWFLVFGFEQSIRDRGGRHGSEVFRSEVLIHLGHLFALTSARCRQFCSSLGGSKCRSGFYFASFVIVCSRLVFSIIFGLL